MGNLEKIWLKRAKLGVMDEVLKAEMEAGVGLVKNLEKNIFRQITLIEKEVWEVLMKSLRGNLPPQTRRANLMLSGISLADSRQKVLVIGECEIQIFGETKPCYRMDEAMDGLEKNMYPDWKGGAFGKALTSGTIFQKDEVYWK